MLILHFLKEFETAEILFLPTNTRPAAKPTAGSDSPEATKRGSRVSARQREKQARILAIKQENERAREMAGTFSRYVHLSCKLENNFLTQT